MKLLKQTIHISTKILTVAVLSLVILTGCRGKGDMPMPPDVEEKQTVTLDLDISIGLTLFRDNITRTFTLPEDGPFEKEASFYEGLRTLRVVILHSDGVIEHNRLVMFDPENGTILNDNLRFQVTSGEQKDIYLFANEETVNYDFDSTMEPGMVFPKEEVADIKITRAPGGAVLDNQTSDTKHYVPMSEMFTINVETPQKSETFFQKEFLFVTRSLIKFSFCIISDSGFPMPSGMLKGITITGLSNSSYYLPRNTEYVPSKYEVSENYLHGREITQFSLPPDPGFSSYTFPMNLDLGAPQNTEVAEYIYLPESDGTYQLSLDFADSELSEFAGSKLLQLTDIPRNTHVKINIYLNGQDLDATVTLLPYTGVSLNPTFGFE